VSHLTPRSRQIRLRELDVVDWASARIKLVPVDTGNPASLYNTRQALVILRDGTGVITFFRDSQLLYPDEDDEDDEVVVGEAIVCHDPSVLPLGTPALEQLVAGRDNLMRACSRSFAADGPHAPAAPTSSEVRPSRALLYSSLLTHYLALAGDSLCVT